VKDRLKQLDNNQKLYSLLKEQHEEELKELTHYMSIITNVNSSLIRNYIHTLLTDGLKHIEYISSLMADIEGASASSSLTKKGIAESIAEERKSAQVLERCIEIANNDKARSLLKSILVDEEHHIKILEHMGELVETYSKK